MGPPAAHGAQRPDASGAREFVRAKARAGSRPRLDAAVCACGADCPVLLGLVACRITHYARFARCVRTDAASQMGMRAARAATSPAVLGAAYARVRLPARSFAAPTVTLAASGKHCGACGDRGRPAGAICGSASSAVPGRGAHAVRASTSDSRILFERSERSSRSELCALAQAEQHSAVGAATPRRPTQHEPLAGAPWRDLRSLRGEQMRMAAMH
jgi:hypothetical protein